MSNDTDAFIFDTVVMMKLTIKRSYVIDYAVDGWLLSTLR